MIVCSFINKNRLFYEFTKTILKLNPNPAHFTFRFQGSPSWNDITTSPPICLIDAICDNDVALPPPDLLMVFVMQTSCSADVTQRLTKSISILQRHQVVEDRVDGGRKVVKEAAHVVKVFVDDSEIFFNSLNVKYSDISISLIISILFSVYVYQQ